jgi:LAS superfamily LD-carboxypeptidase LdcB
MELATLIRNIRSLVSLVTSVLLLACLGGRYGAASEDFAEHAPGEACASSWVLLEARPRLWAAPGGEPSTDRLELESLARVEVLSVASGDDQAERWIEVRTAVQTGWLPDALLAPPPTTVAADALGKIGKEPVDRFRGIAPEYEPTDLLEIRFGYEPERKYRLRREAAQACETLIRTARREGISLEVVSAYRSYATQHRIYLNKLARSGWKQKTVAKPGHSEHQLGTTVDFTGADESTLLRQSFGETAEGRWLRENAPRFGFALSYTEANRERTGYAPEPWHYRYYGVEEASHRHEAALGQAAE